MGKSRVEKIINEIIPYTTSKGIHNHFFKSSGALPRWMKALARVGLKIHLGNFKLTGWAVTMPFYLLKCRKCKKLIVNHPRGYDGHPCGHDNLFDCHFCNSFVPKIIG